MRELRPEASGPVTKDEALIKLLEQQQKMKK
jgi:hypothetical protein